MNALVPKLAVSWAPNQKGDVWTFKLRQGVTFNDGSPFEAADVVASIERVCEPQERLGRPRRAGRDPLAGWHQGPRHLHRAVQPRQAVRRLPVHGGSSSYNTAILPRNYAGDFQKKAVGTGPWMIKSFVTNQSVTMVKNPNYWGKDAQGRQLPYLDALDFVLVTDTSAANLQLQSGAVDVQPQTVFQGGQSVLSDTNLRVDVYPSTGIREVAFNVNKTPWQDYRVRQAVAYCLDRNAINQTLYGGRSNLGYDTFWEPTVFPGSPTPPVRAVDIAKAKSLLSAAGHPNGLDVTLTVANYLENPAYAQLIQAQCKPAGINVKINEISYNAIYAGSNSTTPWLNAPMVIVEWGSRPTPGIYALAMLLPTSAWSSSHWNNSDFLTAFNQYESTTDEATRTTLATKLSSIQQEQTPILVAFYISQLRTQKKNVYNIQGPGSFYFDTSMAYMTM